MMMPDNFIAGIDLNQFPAGLLIFMLLLWLLAMLMQAEEEKKYILQTTSWQKIKVQNRRVSFHMEFFPSNYWK